MRKAFNFYHSHWEQIKLLNSKQQLELFKAICQVQFLEININDIEFNDKTLQLVWTGLRHSLNTSIEGFINKQKGLNKEVVIPLAKGLNKGGAEAPALPPCQQEKGEEEEKEEEEVQLIPAFSDFSIYALTNEPNLNLKALELKYKAWCENGWKDGNDKKIKNWKTKILNTIQYLPKDNGQQKTSTICEAPKDRIE